MPARTPNAVAGRGAGEWARQDSNLGPTDYESAALTAELRARQHKRNAGWIWTDPPTVSKNTDLRILSWPSTGGGGSAT